MLMPSIVLVTDTREDPTFELSWLEYLLYFFGCSKDLMYIAHIRTEESKCSSHDHNLLVSSAGGRGWV